MNRWRRYYHIGGLRDILPNPIGRTGTVRSMPRFCRRRRLGHLEWTARQGIVSYHHRESKDKKTPMRSPYVQKLSRRRAAANHVGEEEFTGLSCLLWIGVILVVRTISVDGGEIDFSRHIRPILSDRCFACHGPDEGAREGKLRLDRNSDDLDSVIDVNEPDGSELLRRITSDDPEFRMPPPSSKRLPLSPKEIDAIRKWIAGGARYNDHWAFVPPARPDPPRADVDGGNAIDQFLRVGWDNVGLEPAPPAPPHVLVRRLSFDLTGLPPTYEDVVRFQNDPSAENYERLVDQYLASPHFGERMAIYWLDLVRYADTNGIHGDNYRPHASYRDWVIKAFNDNMPYDRFVLEQVAGDLLLGATHEQRIASGFNRLNMTTREGGAQPKEYRAIYQADRVRNTAAIFLGVTMGCAQCHDHKFDPFTMRDFYSLGAFFADLEETAVGEQKATLLPRVLHTIEGRQLAEHIAALEDELQRETPELVVAREIWESEFTPPSNRWIPLDIKEVQSSDGELRKQPDGSIRQRYDANPDKARFEVDARGGDGTITALRLEVLSDSVLPSAGPGRASNGNFVLNEVIVTVDGKPVKLASASASHEQQGFSIAHAIDGKEETGWAILPRVGETHNGVFRLADPVQVGQSTSIKIAMAQAYGGAHTIGRFRWWLTRDEVPVEIGDPATAEIAKILAKPRAERVQEEIDKVEHAFRQQTPLLAAQRDELESLRQQQRQRGEAPMAVLVSTSIEPREVRILPRGNWLDGTGPVVEPQVPSVLGHLDHSNRLTRQDLAQWLTSQDNPLTARVYVNRLWKIAFGQGLVRTLDDFGSQGRPPVHPALLDWLATELIESGWDTKHLLKLMITSASYRQSSLASADQRANDPINDYYARQNRFRIDAEMVRDNALAISGLLVHAIGGESVKPYQPAGYWAHLNFPTREWQSDTGEMQHRRGLYTFWCRTFLHPAMLAFDAPTREECTVDRPRSNTPLAALVLLNDPSYVEAARAFAERLVAYDADSDQHRIKFAYQLALQRLPSSDEEEVIRGLLEKTRAHYRDDVAGARQQVISDPEDVADVDLVERAAWVAVARAILNLHEFILRN